jgi:hypothetical protein
VGGKVLFPKKIKKYVYFRETLEIKQEPSQKRKEVKKNEERLGGRFCCFINYCGCFQFCGGEGQT